MPTQKTFIGGGNPAFSRFGFGRPLFCEGEPGSEGTSGTPATLTADEIKQITEPVVQSVKQMVDQAIKPIAEENAALRQRLDDLSKPVRNASFLFGGGAPGVRSGEDPLSSRGYRYSNLLALRQSQRTPEQCKVELELSDRLKKVYQALSLEGTGSVLTPLAADFIADDDASLAVEVKQMVQQGVSGAHAGELRYAFQSAGGIFQGLSQYDDTGLGTFLGPTQKGEMIDLLRAKEFFSRAGATQLALPPNGSIQFDRQTGASTAYWLNEVPGDKTTGSGLTNSQPTSGYLSLRAKKLGTLVRCPNELLKFASPSVEAFIRNDMARVMALEVDLSMLQGSPTGNRIKGLINYSGIHGLTASTVATNGNVLEPNDLGRMMTAVEESEHDLESLGWAWGMRPTLLEQILERRAHVYDGSGTEELGPYLFSANRDDISRGRPAMLRGGPVIKTTQISRTRAKGDSADLTYLIGGCFQHWIIGRVGVIEFASNTQSDTAFQNDQTHFRAIQHIDAGPRYENAFAMIDELELTLP